MWLSITSAASVLGLGVVGFALAIITHRPQQRRVVRTVVAVGRTSFTITYNTQQH